MAKFEDQLKQDAKKVERLSIPSSHAAEMVDIEDEIDNNEGFDMDELVLEEDDDEPAETVGVHQQHSTVMCNKYEEDTYADTVTNKLSSLIIHLTEHDLLHKHIHDEIYIDVMNDDNIHILDEHNEKANDWSLMMSLKTSR